MKKILMFLLLMVVSFVVSSVFVGVIFWCFGLEFTWKIALGIWMIEVFVQWYIKGIHRIGVQA